MEERKKININNIQNITIISIIIIFLVLLLMDNAKFINIKPEFGFVALGAILLPIGIFGYIKKEILFTRAKSFKYSEHSVLGKIINVLISIMGCILIIFGIINCIF